MTTTKNIEEVLKRWHMEVIGLNVETRSGTIEAVARIGNTIVFVHTGPVSARRKHNIRRAAVSWMSAHPKEQAGVKSYRFDAVFDGILLRNVI